MAIKSSGPSTFAALVSVAKQADVVATWEPDETGRSDRDEKRKIRECSGEVYRNYGSTGPRPHMYERHGRGSGRIHSRRFPTLAA
jgi:hypothetical protein